MKRKEYEIPTMLVVELKGQQQLLSGSGGSDQVEDKEDFVLDPNDPMNS